MNFLISGGTGFIGTALCTYLSENGHNIVVKTRRPESVKRDITGISDLSQLNAKEKFDVVINLTGEPIANKRWSKRQKQRILQSRLEATQELVEFLHDSKNKPAVFISGSAIGFYGIGLTDEIIGETSPGDDSFASRLCTQWEQCALQAESSGIRTCLLRTGIVLGKNGGALEKMLTPFRFGLGGKIGAGKQWMPWIHIEDLIGIIIYAVENESLEGPINCTAPYPVTNAVFTKDLGTSLRRPTVFTIPAIMIKILMGEMGKELLLSGKKVLPLKAEKAGFKFKYERIDTALSDVLEQ